MELVELALAGGEAGQLAWDELVRLHSRAVWKVAWSFRLTAADREDVYQSTWIRALERLSQVREPDRLHAWLMTIARNEALAVVRTRERLVPVEQTPAGVAHPVDAEAVERDERYRIAAAALAKLGPRCRELVRLLTAGLSYGEIENVMGWAPGGTAIRRARCLEALRRSPEVRRYLRALSDQAGERGLMNKPMRERSTGPSASERLRRVLEAFDRVLAQEEPLPEHLIPLAQGLYSWRTLDAELLELLVDSSSSAAITMRDDGGHPFMVFGHGERGVHFEYTRHHGENHFDLMGTVIGAGVCQVRIEQPPEVLVTEANEVGEFQLSGLVPGTARITIRLTDDVLMVTPWFVFPDLAEH